MDDENKARLCRVLKEELKQSEDARFLHRLHCVHLVCEGYSCKQVAAWFDDDPSTVARWVRHLEEFGPEGLRDDRKPGRPSKLTDAQLRAIQQDLRNPPHEFGYARRQWDGKLLAEHLERHHAVTLSVRQCQRLLKQLHGRSQASRATATGRTLR